MTNTCNKVMNPSQAARWVEDGATVAIGGVALRRKPMGMLFELVRQRRQRLHLWTFVGSLDVDLLVGAGCVSAVSYAYVGFEHYGLAPNFSRAACQREIEAREYSEWMFICGIRAAVMGVPFLPSHAGRGSDMAQERGMKEITCPYTGENLVAVPAVRFDVGLIHAWRADPLGNVQAPIVPDHLIEVDYLIARAARNVIVTVEEVVPTGQIQHVSHQTVLFPFQVSAIVPAWHGAHPTAVPPFYRADVEWIERYLASAKSPERYAQFLESVTGED